MTKGKRISIALINAVPSGLLTLLIALFFASGTIAENYTDETFVAPQFFWMIPFWAIFVVIACFKRCLIIGIILMYLAPFIFLFLFMRLL
ncbi:hypothetical protein [Alkalicoccobacillus gibsonii]|uniref:hypothetical protein n=1 Tax=Alkalicoccobacillus gibsonii TaxID=79881 RepID=UPI003512F8A7